MGSSFQWKFSKFRTNRDISILFKDSTSVETPPPMGGCMGGWVDSWVGSGQITKNWINFDLIKIIQICLKIYDLLRPPPMGGWVDG